MKALEVKNLSFRYQQDKLVLDDLNFSIEKGKYVSILGHNGSGKSTLVKLLVGLIFAEKGSIYIDSIELKSSTLSEIRKHVALVFQNPDNQFIATTVEEEIAFGLENRNVPSEKMHSLVNEYAKKVGMENYLNKEPCNLSGGQKQRVAIAGALVLSPEILILDEATSMLDPKGRKDIANLVFEMKKSNPLLTIISITHDVNEAFMSDEIILLNKGKIVAQNKPVDIFSNEELLKVVGLKKPFVFEVNQALKEKGISIGNPNNIDDLVNALCR